MSASNNPSGPPQYNENLPWHVRLRCVFFGWHKKPYEMVGHDGASFVAACSRCGMLGLIDSQGNLF